MPDLSLEMVSYETLANALFDNYESVYDIDLATSAYNVYYQSESYQKLNLSRGGENFFVALEKALDGVIHPEDQGYLLRMLSRDALMKGVTQSKYHSVVYRIMRGDKQVYHQLRATLAVVDGKQHVLMGIRDVDAVFRENAAREDELSSERQKAANYLDAVLATSAAYTDSNLTKDLLLDRASGKKEQVGSQVKALPIPDQITRYSEFHEWVCNNLVCENLEKLRKVGDRETLLENFEEGIARASVPFSISIDGGDPIPCRTVYYLYREDATNDVHVLCVIYDLTQQQRQEKELEDLKTALNLSRIHNSASQMKPHFLYNALGSIQEVMLEDPVKAAGLLEDFTIHLRGCIKAMDGDKRIPFSQELDNIRAYTSIERMRFGDRLTVSYDIETTGFSVLPLSIQPLVENAIRHGVHQRGSKGGSVVLRTHEDDDAWVVQVEDTGVGFDIGKYEEALKRGETDSTGLKNIRLRLEKLLGAQIDVQSTVGVGTTVTVRIPKEVDGG